MKEITDKQMKFLVPIFIMMPILLLPAAAAFCETGVFPYSVENPSESFGVSSGREYAKMLTIVLKLKTDLAVASQTDMLADADALRLKPEGILSAERMAGLGRRGGIDRILVGRLSRANGQYISESVIFSVKEERTMQRARLSASSLAELAEKEIREFFPLEIKTTGVSEYNVPMTDTVFLIDCSYSAGADWQSVKQGILAAAKRFTGKGAGFRIYLVPFGSGFGFSKASLSENSVRRLEENLNRLKHAGSYTDTAFKEAMTYTLKSILWRKQAFKRIVLVTCSRISQTGFPMQYGISAKKAGIVIDAVLTGKMSYRDGEVPMLLCSESGGTLRYASYRQQIFNTSGAARYVFFERGRMLYSSLDYLGWKEGVLKSSVYRPEAAAPPNELTELYGSEINRELSPYGMPSAYSAVSGEGVINSGRLESNISSLIAQGAGKNLPDKTSPSASFLANDGGLSIWIGLKNDDDIRFIENKSRTGEFFHIGVIILPDTNAPYGIKPVLVCRDLRSDDVPASFLITLTDAAAQSGRYTEKGLMQPPIWFVRVKAYDVKSSHQEETLDIRNN